MFSIQPQDQNRGLGFLIVLELHGKLNQGKGERLGEIESHRVLSGKGVVDMPQLWI